MKVKMMQVGPIGTNCYILEDEAAHQAAVIDPGGDAPEIIRALEGAELRYILLTHGHYDHTGGAAELERANCPSMDRAADTFAVLLRGAAQAVDEPVRRRVLEQIFYHLGRWVYLVDAADDLKKDAASGNYNPVALRYGLTDGVWTEEARQSFAATLDHSIHMMATAFELWDFGVWTPVLETTLYTGLFRVGKAVLDGTFHGQGKKRDTQESST